MFFYLHLFFFLRLKSKPTRLQLQKIKIEYIISGVAEPVEPKLFGTWRLRCWSRNDLFNKYFRAAILEDVKMKKKTPLRPYIF